ncbi:MAG: hypothetical protein JST82_09780 [Bacteroidetes bacterium]|nr:hypothetical protein [Bacteroidota bacterium]
MKFKTLTPNIFYADIQDGLKLFVQCLGFEVVYDDLASSNPFCVIEKDGLKACLIQDAEFAAKDRPELRLETDNIEEVYTKVNATYPELLHPNSNKVSLKPWQALEFALLDASGVCIIVQQWPNQ